MQKQICKGNTGNIIIPGNVVMHSGGKHDKFMQQGNKNLHRL